MPPPADSRRICGPEESAPYVPAASAAPDQNVLREDSSRRDGRVMDAIRPMFLQCGTVSQASGSAYLEVGRTKVLCSVHGPRDTVRRREFQLMGQISAEVKFAPFACQRRRGHQQDSEESGMSRIVTQALEGAVCLEKFPKAKVDVHVMILEDGGSVLASAITAASVALADATIEMVDMVAGISVAFNSTLTLVDTDSAEEEAVRHNPDWSSLVLALMPASGEIGAMQQRGLTGSAQCSDAVKKAAEACLRIHQVQRQCLMSAVETNKMA